MKSPVSAQIIEGLTEFTHALETGQPLAERFNARRVVLKLKPRAHDPKMVKKARAILGVSQSLFALFLGVSVKTVQAWEQGFLSPNKMACRFMDMIQHEPERYRTLLKEMAAAK